MGDSESSENGGFFTSVMHEIIKSPINLALIGVSGYDIFRFLIKKYFFLTHINVPYICVDKYGKI